MGYAGDITSPKLIKGELMFDSYIRIMIEPTLNAIGQRLVKIGVAANTVTFMGFICGLLAIIGITLKQYHLAAVFIICNRVADGLDGAIARHAKLTNFGGFLDIVCDFIIFSGIVFTFGVTKPNSLIYASFLIFSFIGPVTSSLAYAIVASRKDSNTAGSYKLGSICEGTETAIVMVMFCLMPQYFNTICVTFGVLCWLTTIGKVYNAWIDFGETSMVDTKENHTEAAEGIKPQSSEIIS